MMVFDLMISLGLISTAKFENTDVYNFPMFGTLQYEIPKENAETPGNPGKYIVYGSVTIVNKGFVLAAAENLVQLEPQEIPKPQFIFNEKHRSHLWVFAGSDLMQPPADFDDEKVQKRNVKEVHFGRSSEFVNRIYRAFRKEEELWITLAARYPHLVDTHLEVIPSVMDKFPEEFVWNPFKELQWDVVTIHLNEELTWSPYVLPVAVHWRSAWLVEEYKHFWQVIGIHEQRPWTAQPCTVPGWSPVGNNEIIYHRVAYIRFKDCAAAICGAYPSTCLRYLNNRQHICFKSLGFSDACLFDQGAPVICPWAREGPSEVLGILVKTFECGTQGLPLVFTRTYAIGAFLSLQLGENDDDTSYDNETILIDPKYTEKPDIF